MTTELATAHEPPIEDVLNDLIMNCKELSQLETRLAQFNFFRVLRAGQNEIRHSNVLAWLFDAAESHGLGDFFLRRWLMEVMFNAGKNTGEASWISPILVDALQIDSMEVFRELMSIDLLLRITTKAGDTWIICIENKVNSKQGKGQLERYRNSVAKRFGDASRQFFIFLTKNQEVPEDTNYLVSSYADIASVIDRCLAERQDSLGAEPLLLIRHYQELLREDFMDENESTRLAQEIYKRHQRAIDFIIENKRDPIFEITNLIETTLRQEAQELGIVMSRTGKGRIRFIPNEWDTDINRQGRAWGENSHYLVLELCLYTNRVDLSIIAGRTPDPWADRLWALCANPPFQRSQKVRPQSWLKAYRSISPYSVTPDVEPHDMAEKLLEWTRTELRKDNYLEAVRVLTDLLPDLEGS